MNTDSCTYPGLEAFPLGRQPPNKTVSSSAGRRGGCPGSMGFSSGPKSISRSQASKWHENSLLGEPQDRGGSQGRKDWNVRTLPRSLQELEQVGRCRRLSPEGSELPRVSGAGMGEGTRAGAGAGRLASVSKAASSQEPEPEEGETKPPMGN